MRIRNLAVSLCLTGALASAQQAPVNLRSDAAFAILAGTTVTVTGGGTITGNVGIFPGTGYVAGNPAVTINGTLYAGGPVASQAQADLTLAYNDAAGRSLAPITVAGNVGGQTLAPGLYKSTSSLAISSGDLTLDGQGNPNAVWIFQIASTLTTTSGRQILLAGGANAANIFWQVGSSATIGTTSVFQGNILAAVSISMLTGSTLSGRALAMGGAVTVDTGGGSSATVPVAATVPTVTFTFPGNGANSVPIGDRISAVFSTTMNASTINASSFLVTQAGTPIQGVVSYVGTTATFTPAASLLALKPYAATFTTAVKDLAGNPLPSTYSWTFSTGSAADVTAPTVISTAPTAGAIAVPPANNLSATFSEPMDPASLSVATFTLSQGGVAIAGTVTAVNSTAVFAPLIPLFPGTPYIATVTTGARDLAGNALATAFTWSFTTGSVADVTPPTVISTIPANGAVGVPIGNSLAATFSEPMNPLSITNATFTLQSGATAVVGVVSYGGVTATFTPSSPLAGASVYTATISNGARDLAGNPLAGNFVWNIVTGPAGSPVPNVDLNGTVSGASFVAPVAPGSIAAIFGRNLSIGSANSVLPLPMPVSLGQANFAVGDVAAPIYFVTPTQVNVQIPWELAALSQATVVATVNGVVSNAGTVPLAVFAPGIFTMNASGSGQGAILVAPTANVATAGTPAARGGYVSIYCTGLGPVSNQPATGAPAKANPLSFTLTTPTVFIGGTAAQVTYAGLAPGFAGLYQVNAIVPTGIAIGNAVPVTIQMASATSNTATIAVQ